MSLAGKSVVGAGLSPLAGVVAAVLLAVGGMLLYREGALAALLRQEIAIGQAVINAMAESSLGQGRAHPFSPAEPPDAALMKDLAARIAGGRVIGLAAYNPDGVGILFRNAAQFAGSRQPGNAFDQARAGAPAAEFFVEVTIAAGGHEETRTQAVAMLPYRASAGGPVEAVFEVRSDVSGVLSEIGRGQWRVGAVILAGGMLLLAVLLFPVSRHVEKIVRRHDSRELTTERRLRYEASHDPLTRLANRRRFHQDLEETIRRAQGEAKSFGVMFVDLDRFKLVNDSLGHKAGDQVLATVSERLTSCMRRGDTVYRMGGDEFTVILGELAHAQDAVPVARRINQTLADPLSIRSHEVAVGASIGIAVYPGDGDTPDLLLRNADAAMYAAKEAGRGGFAFYARQMNARYTERLALEAMLRQAVHDRQFVLYYQPRVCARTEELVGFEALLRWRHPRQGILAPGQFISVLEDTGLILRVGAWALLEACRQARRWMEAGRRMRVSVNVSARQFRHEHFVALVHKVLADTGLPPELLELELTESMLMEDSEGIVNTMGAIRRLGVSLSIDDFGTGYSSLSYLARLPVDFLKIDRSFVGKALTSERDDAVVSAITVLARSLGMGVVAEGVEDAQQTLFLRAMGCAELQGNFLGVPRPAEELSLSPPAAVAEAAHSAGSQLSDGILGAGTAAAGSGAINGSVS